MSQQNNIDQLDVGPFVLLNKGSAPDIYAEGISHVLLGYPVTKVVFHTMMEPATPQNKEIRKATAVLAIPTVSLIESAQLILQVCKGGVGDLTGFNALQGQKIQDLLSAIEIREQPASPPA